MRTLTRQAPGTRTAPNRHRRPAMERQPNGNETTLLRCPKCGRSVVTLARADAWCLPCGKPMQRVRSKAPA